jgi:RNA polymerase sigma factor (sigma-70 family)
VFRPPGRSIASGPRLRIVSLAESLLRAADQKPEKIALDARDLQLSYGRLARNARAIASGLAAHGVEAGTSIGLLLPSGAPLVECLYGAWMNGNMVVPLSNPAQLTELMHGVACSDLGALVVSERALPDVEIRLWLLNWQPRIFVVGNPGAHQRYARLLEAKPGAGRPPRGHERVLTHYGQTEPRRDAMLTSDNLVAQIKVCRELLSVSSSDRWLNVMDSADPFGLLMTVTCVDACATVVTRGESDLDAALLVAQLRDERITLFAANSALLDHVLEHTRSDEVALPTLRRCVELGGSMQGDRLTMVEKALSCPVYRSYFVNEAGLVSCNLRRSGNADSVGIPHPSFLIRIEDDHGRPKRRADNGRILLRGPAVGTGSALIDSSTLRTRFLGWLVTMDYGRFELDGSLVRGALHASDTPVVGSSPGLPELVRDHVRAVLGMLRRMGVPPCGVQDVAVEVFVAANERLADFDGTVSSRTLLCGICRERAASYLRAKNRRIRLWQAWLNEPEAPSEQEHEELRLENEMVLRLQRALSELTDMEREVFMLFRIEDLPPRVDVFEQHPRDLCKLAAKWPRTRANHRQPLGFFARF